jgi:anaerobic dimethyl sulfoxide reductase subunit A
MRFIMSETRYLPVSCNKDCGAGCALTAQIKNGVLQKIIDSPLRLSYMKGCIKGYRMGESVYHKDRITTPLIRTGERGSSHFRKAGWDEALNLIASRLQTLKDEGRCSELMRIGGSGSCRGALHNTDLVTQRFLSLYGNYTDTHGNFSSEASDFVKKPIFGTPYVGIDARTLLDSKNIILWGFNPMDTRFDCEVESILLEASKRGIPITVIDPRKTRTAENLKATWIPIKPGSDSAFMLAILWTLIEEKLINRDYLETYSRGFEKLEAYISGDLDGTAKSPLWASPLCGISEKEIRQFAETYADRKPTALLPGLSLQRAIGGENTDRLGAVLQLATGNTGKPGGSSGSSQWNKLEKPKLAKLPVPLNSHITKIPVYSWADAVLEGKKGGYPGDISFLYNVGGNYIGQGSDTEKSIKAFEKADFSVTHEYFKTATASHSDVILPVTTFLEREDIISTQNNFIFYSAQAIEPEGEAKNDFTIFSLLADRLGFGKLYHEDKTDEQWIESFLSQSELGDINEFKSRGFYAAPFRTRVGLSDFIKNPKEYPLQTESGKIEIASPEFESLGGTLIPEVIPFETSGIFPLRMISPHEKYRIHSQFDNIPSMKKLCDDRLWMNVYDGESRDLTDGETVTVVSPEGRISVPVFLTEKISRGTVSLNQGTWVSKSGDLEVGNVNFLTSTRPTLPSKGSRTHSITVNVLKI